MQHPISREQLLPAKISTGPFTIHSFTCPLASDEAGHGRHREVTEPSRFKGPWKFPQTAIQIKRHSLDPSQASLKGQENLKRHSVGPEAQKRGSHKRSGMG
jgi:hypothetical protein